MKGYFKRAGKYKNDCGNIEVSDIDVKQKKVFEIGKQAQAYVSAGVFEIDSGKKQESKKELAKKIVKKESKKDSE